MGELQCYAAKIVQNVVMKGLVLATVIKKTVGFNKTVSAQLGVTKPVG